ncbi:MAG: hypothetical protein ACTSVY_05085 [Candidatus Helarchaeota archaeon]
MTSQDPNVICKFGHEEMLILYASSNFTNFCYICTECSENNKKTSLDILEKKGNSIKISVENLKVICPQNHDSDENCYIIINEVPELDIIETFYICSTCKLEYGIEILPEEFSH